MRSFFILVLTIGVSHLLSSSVLARISVHHHTKIASNQGGFGSIDSDTWFAYDSTNLGDLDGDGIDDLAVGHRVYDQYERGAVQILFLNADGTVKSNTTITKGQSGLPDVNTSHFGHAVASLGDLDGDGLSDLAVGEPDIWTGTATTGRVWILLLNADGTVKSTQQIYTGSAGFTGTLENYDDFGYSVAWLGDLSGDGTVELAVGAPEPSAGTPSTAGSVWILSLQSDGTVASHVQLTEGMNGLSGLTVAEWFGTSVTGIGDLDGNGFDDLAVGSKFQDGAVTVLFLEAGSVVQGMQRIGGIYGGTPTIDFGRSVAWLSDLGCGRSGLAVGSPWDYGGDGAVWILFLTPAGAVEHQQEISEFEGTFSGPVGGESRFGHVAELGDFDGNGIDDLAVGAPEELNERGAQWLLFLDTSRVDPRHVDFGTVYTTDVVDTTITITNEGCAPVNGDITVTGSGFSILDGGGPFTLAPDASQTVDVRFAPTDGNHRPGTLDTNTSCGIVELEGIGRIPVNPCLGHWNLDTFNAANLDTIPDNHALWCGVQAGEPGFAYPPGYGNLWDEPLVWAAPVLNPFTVNDVRLTFVYNIDTLGGDELRIERLSKGNWIELYRESGSNRDGDGEFTTPFVFDQTYAFPPEDLVPVAGQPGVVIRLRFVSDYSQSDADIFDTDGAVQIDDLRVYVRGELVSQADFEPGGSDGGWCTEPDVDYPDPTSYWATGFEAPPAGNGTDGVVRALTVYGGELVAAGEFTQAGTAAVNNVASFDGTTWSALGDGILGDRVYSLAVHEGNLYAAGIFTTAGGVPAANVARWDGTTWHAVGDGLPPFVQGLYSFDGKLWAGVSPAVSIQRPGLLAWWDGVTWATYDLPAPSPYWRIIDFAEFNGTLHAVGSAGFGGWMMWWDGSQLVGPGDVFNGNVDGVLPYQGLLVMCGGWTFGAPGSSYGITGWNGSDWVSRPPPPSFTPLQMAEYNGRLVVVGDMYPLVTSYENETTVPMGSSQGWYGTAEDVAVYEGSVYVGGLFDEMSTRACSNIAKWTDPQVVAVEDGPPSAEGLALFAAKPNPFNPRTTLTFALSRGGQVHLAIFDLRGRQVRVLLDAFHTAGTHAITWDGTDARGATVASGVYVARVSARGQSAVQKVALMK